MPSPVQLGTSVLGIDRKGLHALRHALGAPPADPSTCGGAELATLSVVDCAGIDPVPSLADQAGTIVLEVCDDGRGFNPDSSFPGHLGLRSMSERATQLGGTLQIESAPQSLPAANEMSAAAKEMDKAQGSLDKAVASEAQPAQKLAVDHLVTAERMLKQQIAKLEHDKQELAKHRRHRRHRRRNV